MKANESATEILRRPYSRLLVPDEAGGFSAQLMEFPGCFAEGETADEAIANLESAALSWVEAAQAQGMVIPPPTGGQEDASGRFVLRLPRSMHQRAIRYAQRDGVSLNQFVVAALAERIGTELAVARVEQRLEFYFVRLERTLRFTQRGSNEPGERWKEPIKPHASAPNGVQTQLN